MSAPTWDSSPSEEASLSWTTAALEDSSLDASDCALSSAEELPGSLTASDTSWDTSALDSSQELSPWETGLSEA